MLFWQEALTFRKDLHCKMPLAPCTDSVICMPHSGAPCHVVMDAETRACSCSHREFTELDGGVLIPNAELEAERWRGRQLELAASAAQATRPGAFPAPSRRRPRAGHYPAGFSPYRMDERRGAVPLERRYIRNDIKVQLCYVVYVRLAEPCLLTSPA